MNVFGSSNLPMTAADELALPPPMEIPPLSEVESTRLANRMWAVLMTFTLMVLNFVPTLLTLDPVPSLINNIAIVTTSGNTYIVTIMAGLGIVLSIPYLIMLIFAPRCVHRVAIINTAAAGYACAAVIWVLMARLSTGLDYGYFAYVLGAHGLVNLAAFFFIALSRNHEILRELYIGKYRQ